MTALRSSLPICKRSNCLCGGSAIVIVLHSSIAQHLISEEGSVMILHPFLPAPRGQSRQTSHTTEAEAVQTKLPARVNLILRDLKGKVFRVVFDLAWCNLT